ncbi:MAG: helix-turn-helix domain-containing protein [Microbispora sp.]|nr:helix-turn-helix domain-containing protein [Microbispora sp.]
MDARLMTPAEVAEFLRITTDDVHAMVADRELYALRVGEELLIPFGALREFVHGAWVSEAWAS